MGKTEETAGQPNKGKHPGGRPSKIVDLSDLEDKIDQYFNETEPKPITTTSEGGDIIVITDKNGNAVMTQTSPTVAGLAYFLGYADRQSLYDLKSKEEFSCSIKRAILRIERHHEQNLSLRDKPVGDIFWLKNHGWTDKQEVEHSGSVQIIDDIPRNKK